jgi:hypothetical protein
MDKTWRVIISGWKGNFWFGPTEGQSSSVDLCVLFGAGQRSRLANKGIFGPSCAVACVISLLLTQRRWWAISRSYWALCSGLLQLVFPPKFIEFCSKRKPKFVEFSLKKTSKLRWLGVQPKFRHRKAVQTSSNYAWWNAYTATIYPLQSKMNVLSL